jgi:hypothetical protein
MKRPEKKVVSSFVCLATEKKMETTFFLFTSSNFEETTAVFFFVKINWKKTLFFHFLFLLRKNNPSQIEKRKLKKTKKNSAKKSGGKKIMSGVLRKTKPYKCLAKSVPGFSDEAVRQVMVALKNLGKRKPKQLIIAVIADFLEVHFFLWRCLFFFLAASHCRVSVSRCVWICVDAEGVQKGACLRDTATHRPDEPRAAAAHRPVNPKPPQTAADAAGAG